MAMKKYLLALSCALLSACAGTSVLTLKPAAPREANCPLDLYASEAEVPKKFETLCIVESHTGTGWKDERTANAAIELARPELCKCGAQAAVIIDSSSKRSPDLLTSVFTPAQDMRGNAQVKGIRFVDSEASR
jgi:hypothetical protein